MDFGFILVLVSSHDELGESFSVAKIQHSYCALGKKFFVQITFSVWGLCCSLLQLLQLDLQSETLVFSAYKVGLHFLFFLFLQ